LTVSAAVSEPPGNEVLSASVMLPALSARMNAASSRKEAEVDPNRMTGGSLSGVTPTDRTPIGLQTLESLMSNEIHRWRAVGLSPVFE